MEHVATSADVAAMVGRLRARGWASDPNFDAHVANLHRAVVTVVVGGQATENAASG